LRFIERQLKNSIHCPVSLCVYQGNIKPYGG
jgi:hypothetical protein